MDIQQNMAPVPAKAQAPAKVDKAAKAERVDRSKEDTDARVAAPAFSQLLQGLQSEAVDAVALGQPHLSDVAATPLLLGELPIESLLGQTQLLDTANADTALQDGSFLLAQQEAGLASAGHPALGGGAQPHVALGRQVATVAAGVQAATPAPVTGEAASAMTTALAVTAQATGAAEGLAQAVSEGLQTEQPSEGRVTLQGAWQLEDPKTVPHPTLQRLMGSVEQWAAANAGVQPKPVDRPTNASGASSAEWLSAGQGSGTRLMENAVREAQQAQDASMDAQHDAPVEDMRFWLQGKQQKAQVVLEKDGQPVRVQVAMRGNAAHVTFSTDQAQTREMLDASLAQLRDMLREQGVELAEVTVQADARGGQSSSDHAPRSPWDSAPTQHAQVTVPMEATPQQTAPRGRGVDVYA